MLLRVECITESLIFKNYRASDFIVCGNHGLVLLGMKSDIPLIINLVPYLS